MSPGKHASLALFTANMAIMKDMFQLLLLVPAVAAIPNSALREERQAQEQADGQVYQIQDGQLQTYPTPVSQISDGQVQIQSSAAGYTPSSCAEPAMLLPTVTLGCGIVTGTSTSLPSATATVNKFLGVPFAQSPPQRFSPPEKVASCNVEATAWKPACIQQFTYPQARQAFTKAVFDSTTSEESEDCLYLNVYAPSSPAPAGGRAVMFWLFGGSLQFGNAGQPVYDGSWFAAYEDVIVVTVNYRTNVFGFATSPELPITEQNLGFLDQRAGLMWVQENIAAFGGSPDKVTIFGESAGGFSVDALLTSYPAKSKPPFRAAILQSGQFSYNSSPRPSTAGLWNQLADILGCPGTYGSNLACLRAANASDIKQVIEENILEFNPVADNVTLVSSPLNQRRSGNIAHIPILAGSNSQEGRAFTVGTTNTTSFLQSMDINDPAVIKGLESAYSPYTEASGDEAWAQAADIITEFIFQCSTLNLLRDTAAIGIPAWRYYFNASFANTQAYPRLGVYHASEIPIVYSTYARTNVTVQEYTLSEAMRGAWARFAKNPAGGPGWNQIGSGSASDVLTGAMSEAKGAIYLSEDGNITQGMWDLGVFGNRGDILGSGVTIMDSEEVDFRCGLFSSTYEGNAIIG